MVADSAFVGLGVSVWEIWFVHPFSSPSAPGSRGPEGRMWIVLNLAAAIPRALQEELIKSKNDKFFVSILQGTNHDWLWDPFDIHGPVWILGTLT